jgi:hypothetical protein
MRLSTIQRHRFPVQSMKEDRMSLEVVDVDQPIERPAFDFTFFVKARLSVVLVSTERLASDWALIWQW